MSKFFPYLIILIFFNVLRVAVSADGTAEFPLEEKYKVLSQDWEPIHPIVNPVQG